MGDNLRSDKCININIEKFLEQFDKEYNLLYQNNDNAAGFDEAVEAFDEFVKKHKEFIGEFVKYRGDFISSDREAASFMFALEDMEQ